MGRETAWRTGLLAAAIVLAAACGSPAPARAPAASPAAELEPPATVEELTALGERIIVLHPVYGYYVECINLPENGALPPSMENDYSACPITPRLLAVMAAVPEGTTVKANEQAHFCPCQQNPSGDRQINVWPAPGGGLIEIVQYRGRVKTELLAARVNGRLLVDDVAAKGDVDTGPVAFQEKPAPPTPVPSPPAGSTGGRVLDVPLFKQAFQLSCESASLRMALAYRGIQTTDSAILKLIGSDLRPAYQDADGRLRWGDPYETFVGSVNGSEVALTGYGTYYPPIARAAAALGGHVLRQGEGIAASDVYQAVLDGHPVVAWVTYHWATGTRHDYLSFGGRSIPYAGPIEHAVTVVGVRGGEVLVNNPWSGPEWVSKATFEAAYATYNRMAVVLE